MLTNVTELYGKLDTGSIKHSFNLGVEFSRETNKNASYGVKNGPGSTTCPAIFAAGSLDRSEEHTSELQSLMRISYAVFCLKKKKHKTTTTTKIISDHRHQKTTIQ